MFEKLINHIVEQRNKQQYINALVTVAELQTLLLKEFSDLQKGSRLTTHAPDVLVQCVECGALLETDVHCDNCGSFHPTRR